MNRRELLAASCLAGLGPLANHARGKDAPVPNKEFYELRLYHVAAGAKEQALHEFLAKAAIPAMNRIGIKPVGVFGITKGTEAEVYVLMPHKDLASVATATGRMLADKDFVKAGAAFMDAPKSDPAFKRIESSLLLAFDQIPKLQVPPRKETRVFQLRIYESHSVKKGRKKVEMFNAGGEIAIFRRAGLKPVFFGEAIVGAKLPNLTYMVVHDDMEASKASWQKFLGDPAWKKLHSDPAYKDTVSNITNMFLKPAACSQI